MKKSLCIPFCILSTILLASFNLPLALVNSDIVGEWQIDSKVLGSNKRNTYTFSPNKTFVYNTDGEDALIEVIKISGTYFIRKDTVYIKPITVTKRIGGTLTKNVETTMNDSWEIAGGVIKTLKVPNSPVYPVIIKVISKHKVLEIDDVLYYKI